MTDYKALVEWLRDFTGPGSKGTNEAADAVEALEQRALAAEARIEKVRTNWSRRYSDTGNLLPDATEAITAALAAAPSGLVEDMRRNTAAQAWDEGYFDGRRQDNEGDDGPRFINPYRTGDSA